jgi:hypothetical protein
MITVFREKRRKIGGIFNIDYFFYSVTKNGFRIKKKPEG